MVTRLSLEGVRCQECGEKLIDARASHSKGHAGFRVRRSGEDGVELPEDCDS